jgi:3-hydroxyacyl-[acyl-carrier-protein] dehydratase
MRRAGRRAMESTLDPDILQQIKTILRRDLKLGPDAVLEDQTPFFGGDMDLDSLDLLLLVTSIERQFGVRIPNEAVGKEVFQDVSTLARYVQDHGGSQRANGAAMANAQGDWISKLPHGPEFRFVTRTTEVRPGEMARGVWSVTGKEPFFAGHFPGHPVVPGVLIAEALAQLSGLAGPIEAGRQGKLAHVDVRFERPVQPPAEIELYAKVAGMHGKLQMSEVEAHVGQDLVVRGQITLLREKA